MMIVHVQKRDMYTKIEELYNTYNALPIQLHEMQILVLVHKILYHKEALPEIFAKYFIPNNLIHGYSTVLEKKICCICIL